MAKKLKDYYNTAYLRLLADKLSTVYTDLATEQFVTNTKTKLYGQPFLARQDVITKALTDHLPDNYVGNLAIFSQILGPELQRSEGMFTEGWWLWPIGRYVEHHGCTDPKASIAFIYELTKRFTGEFAIRPLIRQRPRTTLSLLEKWSRDDNVHVRRLSSEGMRIHLPWTSKMTAAVEEFDLFSTILTNLRNDQEKFVQKSVGNNLNDLMKHDSGKAKQIITNWQTENVSRETKWIIKHGMRSLRK